MTALIIQPEQNIYPGIYRPKEELQLLSNDFFELEDINTIPSFSLEEAKDHYVIEASLPDVPRENIFIQVHDEIISIIIKDAALHIPALHSNKIDEHGFAYHHIRLAEHIDIGFISASYRKGLLRIYIPKCECSCDLREQEVVIY